MCLQVRDAMAHIWHALLDDPKASVTQHFDGEQLLLRLGFALCYTTLTRLRLPVALLASPSFLGAPSLPHPISMQPS